VGVLYETIIFEVKDGVATLTLNRPEVFNSLNDTLAEEVLDALKQATREESIRALLVTGAGKAFCAGQDLKSIAGQAGTRSISEHMARTWSPIVRRIRELEKPVVAALNGVAAGAGCSLALACDLRIASETAGLMVAFSRVGLIPDAGGTWTLPRLVGMGKALELAFLAERIDAATALQLGLVNWVVPADRLQEEAEALARRLAEGPTLAFGLTKRAMNRGATLAFHEALEYEGMLQEVAGHSADYVEGVRAFVDKRPARFQGR
jgi:2-(1,2-epoxy-1,2-dihydrophenyl)acetyl-CoA isomerase